MISIRIIGVPRSGTNFVKFLIETSSDLQTGFNIGWWKHSIIPSIMKGREQIHDQIPTVILFREPLEQMVSFYNFAKLGRTSIRGETINFSKFIRKPIFMRPSNSIEYLFDSPIAYWQQFYSAALSWTEPKTFLDLGVICQHPEFVAKSLSKLLQEQVCFNQLIPDIKLYMGRNTDRPVTDNWSFEKHITLKDEKEKNRIIQENLSEEDRNYILTEDIINLNTRLKKQFLMD